MPTLGNTPRPAYVYDTETDTWVPVGVGAHTHAYIPNTLVDAKGDILTASANDVPAILSKGADGTVLVSDSTTSTGLAWQPYGAQQTAGKNMVINGAFDFWQRGTSFTTGAFQYAADRWRIGRGAFQTGGTYTRESANLDGFRYCIRVKRDAGGNGVGGGYLATSFETSESLRFSGKTVTLSFYAKKSASYTGGSLSVVLQNATGIDETNFAESNFATGANNLLNNAVTGLTTSWQRFSLTAQVPSNSTQLGIRIIVEYAGTAPADDYVDITGVQLEAGSIATHFSKATGTLSSELAACQRYYIRMPSGTGSYTPFATGQVYSSTGAQIVVNHPVAMRIPPTSIEYASLGITNSGAGVVVPTSFSLSNPGQTASMLLTTNASGLVAGYSTLLVAATTTSAYLAFNAEL